MKTNSPNTTQHLIMTDINLKDNNNDNYDQHTQNMLEILDKMQDRIQEFEKITQYETEEVMKDLELYRLLFEIEIIKQHHEMNRILENTTKEHLQTPQRNYRIGTRKSKRKTVKVNYAR